MSIWERMVLAVHLVITSVLLVMVYVAFILRVFGPPPPQPLTIEFRNGEQQEEPAPPSALGPPASGTHI